jgi:hypothetical protein
MNLDPTLNPASLQGAGTSLFMVGNLGRDSSDNAFNPGVGRSLALPKEFCFHVALIDLAVVHEPIPPDCLTVS